MAASSTPEGQHLPCHVGIVMDGNGRWAKLRGKPRLEGHRQGADRARDVVEWAHELGIRQISLFAFSTENWSRPKQEVSGLMSLLATLLPREIPRMQEKQVRLRVLGDISKLPGAARRAVARACDATRENKGIELILCLNYGGQQEIIEGIRSFVGQAGSRTELEHELASLTPETFRSHLWCADLKPVDLLIRTGGEMRISNFHLWDAAYAELYFTDCLWPDFSREELKAALDDYAGRERRFGKISEQIADG